MHATIVIVNIKTEFIDAFKEEVRKHAILSVNEDPGWLRFDVVQDDEDPSRFYYYESCEDAEAAKVHAEAEHTKAFRAMTEPWRSEPNVIRRGTPIAP